VFAAGQIVGNYRILSKLGTGGMGAVYLAEHPLIGKKVALKVIHRELAGNREVVQRFFQEARAVNTIGHEHIVEIHDFGQTPQGDHFYIMEYLDGPTLARLISREGGLEVRRALHISAQLASGLAAAHAAGVIHRDLKPDNVMLLTRQGHTDFVKILDFGLAKMFASGNAPLTAYGVVLGTPQYMSPEACESKRDIDHRTDIYAVGVLLFQMLTGKLPFDGSSMGEVLVKQVTQLPPAPRGMNPTIPPSVEQIVLRCLAKAPSGRFATMLALREALLQPEAYLASSPPMAAARSVAPGEGPDARTMIAQLERARTAEAFTAPTVERDGGPRLGELGVARTVAMAAAPAGALAASSSAQANTVLGSGLGALTGGAAGAGAVAARAVTEGSAPIAPPPVTIENRTMLIATPVGYSSASPRPRWQLITAVASLSLLVGTAAAMLARGDSDDASGGARDGGPASAAGPADAAVTDAATVALVDAAPPDAPPPLPAPPPATEVAIETVPTGATIWIAGRNRGKAPVRLRFDPSTTRLTIEARLAGFTTKRQTLTLKGPMSVQLNLEEAPERPPRPTRPKRKPRSSDELMRP
jgi:eukaryotic-like serine/threonine-protein kinase